MTEYRSNTTFAEMARLIEGAQRLVVTSHVKPDGDAMGSMLALARALGTLGKTVDLFLMGPVEGPLRCVAGATPFRLVEHELPSDEFDLAIVVDTGAWSQVEPLQAWLKRHHSKVVGIDHHAHGEALAAKRIVDTSAAATTQLIVPLLDELGCELTGGLGGVAEALFVGLATDTGWFKYQNADAATFSLAARLLKAGVDKSRLYQVIEETYSPPRLGLEARALASAEFALHGAAAIMSLRPGDFQAAGGSMEDLTGIVNMPMVVGRVRLSILLAQDKPQLTKVSLRSKPPAVLVDEEGRHDYGLFDVNLLAQKLGGGGHKHAAGAKLRVDLDEAKVQVLAVLG